MPEKDYLHEFLQYAHDRQATDMHLCPGSKPLIRVNGQLAEIDETGIPEPGFVTVAMINDMIDIMLNDAKKKVLQDKKVIDFSFSKPGMGRFRANIYSQRGSFAVAIRMLPFEIPQFSDLGLPAVVESFTSKSRGLFLVTGATGSGKSTTMASLINIINERYNYHIITIEDPIEYLHRHKRSLVTQREVGEDAESFATALRSALREDPDVIMVGEMRDPETIAIALSAAETGHLVISTLHTVGAAKSIDRIMDAIPPAQQNQIRSQFATICEGIISQQLLPRIDQPGLVMASEVMFVNPAIRNLIREGKQFQINSIMQTGQSQGMQLMEEDLARLCNANIISKEEATLRASDQQLLHQFLHRR
ncbi:MAG: PilT/PilU family type 4a pilus ATPase [Clostridiales bacterium]|jgi:twitching motility protein PilT|nr:PilT/PilU family type 4a pilus ATPase [Clostridiales bacterium]